MKNVLSSLTITATLAIGLLPIGGTVHPAQALSCIQQTLSQKYTEATIVAIIEPTTLVSTDHSNSIASEFTWNAVVKQRFKGGIAATITLKDLAWPGDSNTISRLRAGEEFLVFLNSEKELGICEYPRSIKDEPLTTTDLALLRQDSPSCEDYVCADGSTFPSCSADGSVIKYFAEPCLTHGGPAESVSSSSQSNTSSFSDVDSSTMYYSAIMWAKKTGVVQGYADGSFKPNAPINRAEFLKILFPDTLAVCRAFYNYTDVDPTAWYAVYVQIASCQGVVRGYEDNTFKPAANINVAEAAKIIVKVDSNNSVEQANRSDWYTPFISYLQVNGAFPESIEFANDELTRGEMVEIMYQLQNTTTTSSSSAPAGFMQQTEFVGRIIPSAVAQFEYDLLLDAPITYDGQVITKLPLSLRNTALYSELAVFLEQKVRIRGAAKYSTSDLASIVVESVVSLQTGRTAKQECQANNGTWQQGGLLGTYSCVYTTSDAGVVCTDSDQCEEKCIYTNTDVDAQIGDTVSGTCQRTTSPFGCYATVESGKLEPMICVD